MEVFFYGLFMDVTILLKNGIKPSNPRRGYLNDYALKIGNRASLNPCKNEKSYGNTKRGPLSFAFPPFSQPTSLL